MNTNYEKAIELMNKGFASKHPTFKDTGCIFIDLDKLMVFDADHRHNYDRHIEKIKDWYKQGTE